MPKRSRLEITFDVLTVIASGEAKPTRIMYGSNLSWRALQGVLQGLVAQGFVAETPVNRGKRYHVTAKGDRALRYYRRAATGLSASAVLREAPAE